MTMQDYGCFPIWHKETDLWILDLETNNSDRMNLNSDYTDSYHSWSSNGKWIVFSSKRDDGLTARPYIAYIGDNGQSAKPFLLPAEDPDFYDRFIKSYNVPEFSDIEIRLNPGKLRRISLRESIQAGWASK